MEMRTKMGIKNAKRQQATERLQLLESRLA
jgi:hypothetical protein